MSDYAWFTGSLVFTFLFIVLIIDMAAYSANINCPISVENMYQKFNNSDYIGGTTSMVSLFLSPCSGLEWWVYTLLLIIVIGDVVFLTPFIGGG